MKQFLKAALTVGLLSTTTVSYSGSNSHTAIIDAYNDAYTTGGVIVTTSKLGRVSITTLQLPNDKAKLCGTFSTLVDDIVVTLDDFSRVNVVCD